MGGGSTPTAQLKTVKEYTYLPNGDQGTSTEYLEFDSKPDKQGVTMTLGFTYDSLGRITQKGYKENGITKEQYQANGYDGRGYLLGNSYWDGYQTTEKAYSRNYTYDAIGRMTQSHLTSGSNTKGVSYQYDKVGNRLQEEVTTTMGGTTKTQQTRYSYNNLYQLTGMDQKLSAQTNWQRELTYLYDDYGNRAYELQHVVNLDNPTAANVGTAYGAVKYTYDNANQLMERSTTLAQGQTLTADNVSGKTYSAEEQNVYNGEGQRIRKLYGEDTNSDGMLDLYTRYFYMGGALAFSAPGEADLAEGENIIAPDGQVVAGKRKRTDTGEEKYYFSHYDLQGSVTNMVSANVSGVYLAEGNDYDPFGKEESLITKTTGEGISNEMKYTGAVEDRPVLIGDGSSGGLYYLSARHYDPNTGRFLQQDTYKGDAHTPWTQNLYAYTGNNPVNYVDPTGHAPHTYMNDGGDGITLKKAAIGAGTTIAVAARKAKPDYGIPKEKYDPYKRNPALSPDDNQYMLDIDYGIGGEGDTRAFYGIFNTALYVYGLVTWNVPIVLSMTAGFMFGYQDAKSNGATPEEALSTANENAFIGGLSGGLTSFIGKALGVGGKVWQKAGGDPLWPPYDGGYPVSKQTITMKPGQTFGRYGNPQGNYGTPLGTLPNGLSLRPGQDMTYRRYRVLQPIPNVEQSIALPWFNQPGNGVQFKFPHTVEQLDDMDKIMELVQ